MTEHTKPDNLDSPVLDCQAQTRQVGFVWIKRHLAILVGFAVAIVAAVGYWRPDLLIPLGLTGPVALKESHHAASQEQIVDRASALAIRLKDKPDDVEGWSMLARSYITLGRYAEAADAYSHLVKLRPGNAELLADYADVLAMSMNKKLLGEPQVLIKRALDLDPKNVKALALSATASFQERDYAAAVDQWKKILVLVPPESEVARSTMSSIGEAQNLAEQSSKAESPEPQAGGSTPRQIATGQMGNERGSAQVSGIVQLDAGLRTTVLDTDTVFVFVRAAEGSSRPLAVLRKQVRDLPTSFVLGDQMSIGPYAKISDQRALIVGARISRSGNATPGAGDLEGQSEPVRPGAKNIMIRINRQRD